MGERITFHNKDLEIASELILESDYCPELETTLYAYIPGEFVFEKYIDSMLIIDVLMRNPQDAEITSLHKAIKYAEIITDIPKSTLSLKCGTPQYKAFPKDEFLQVLNLEINKLAVEKCKFLKPVGGPSLDNELIHKIILLMETELKQGISKNHASENISVDLMNEGLLIHKTTIFNLFSPGTDTYKSLSKDCPDLKKTIDDINLKYGQH